MKALYITPSITALNEDRTIDLESQRHHYDFLIRGGVDDILVSGSIGEFFAFPLEERKKLALESIRAIDHRVRCIIGTSSMFYEEIVPFSNEVLKAGADAVMIISPYYFPMDQEALFRYYDDLFTRIEGRVYIYNFPDRTGYSIAPETVLRLRRAHENLAGIKDTISGVDHTRDLARTIRPEFPDFEIFSGFDDNAAHNILNGGDGVIGGLSNVAPELCSGWMKAIRKEDLAAVSKGQQTINGMFDIYSIAPQFITTIKEGARLRGSIAHNTCTFPIASASPEQSAKIAEILRRFDLL